MKIPAPCYATCGSKSIVKSGHNSCGTQQYLCKACGAGLNIVFETDNGLLGTGLFSGAYDFDNLTMAGASQPAYLKLNRSRLPTSADAAAALFTAFQDLHARGTGLYASIMWPELQVVAWNDVVYAEPDKHIAAAWRTNTLGALKETVEAMTEVMKLGMSIVPVGGNVIAIADTSQAITDHKPASAAVSMAAICAPQFLEFV